MDINHLAVARVWKCIMSGRDKAEIVHVGGDRTKLDNRMVSEAKLDRIMGEYATIFVMPYDAAKHMVDTINDQNMSMT